MANLDAFLDLFRKEMEQSGMAMNIRNPQALAFQAAVFCREQMNKTIVQNAVNAELASSLAKADNIDPTGENTCDECSKRKRRKQDGESNSYIDVNQNAGAIADASNEEPPPSMFKLNVDCFTEIFEFLSLEELLELRVTCKRMKRVVDYYIESNLLARVLFIDDKHLIEIHKSKPTEHSNFFKHLFISAKVMELFFEDIKHILCRVESICFEGLYISGDLFESFLKFCDNLKGLSIKKKLSQIDFGIEWLFHRYPKLEKFEFTDSSGRGYLSFIELKTFFELNSSIRSFSTDSRFLLANGHWMIGTNIKFDRLHVRLKNNDDFDDVDEEDYIDWGYDDINSILNLLNSFYEQKLYQKLDISCAFRRKNMNFIQKLHAVDKLYLWATMETPHISILDTIKELSIDDSQSMPDGILELMATNFINLKRIQFSSGRPRDIQPFIRHSSQIKQVICNMLKPDGLELEVDLSKLVALNKERKKLAQARKVTIQIDEKIFLKLKWTSQIDFSLIEFRRADSDILFAGLPFFDPI